MTLTGYNITIEQIEALRAEAMTAGDGAQVDICDAAIKDIRNGRRDAGRVKHTKACADVINYAQGEAQ